METHRKYIDIQYIMKGKNRMGWTPAHLLEGKGQGYQELQEDLSGDLEFYESKPQTWFETLVGSVIIFYPEDAHAPLNGEGEVVKIVLKVQL
jgi:biofilm protein TabA